VEYANAAIVVKDPEALKENLEQIYALRLFYDEAYQPYTGEQKEEPWETQHEVPGEVESLVPISMKADERNS
jgi:hypothetical protein